MARKLLLADDSLTIQKVVELVMTPENFEIKAFNDGQQALETLKAFVPDIILADIDMPKLNGYQLCEKIKNDMATAHIPVILLVGAFEQFNEEYAKAVYADDYIIKPFESKELISKVKALLAASEPYAAQKSYVHKTKATDVAKEEVFPVLPEISEEPKWDEDIPVAIDEEEKIEAIGGGITVDVDEEYEARAALSEKIKDFEDELSEALKGVPQTGQIGQKVKTMHLPSKDEIADIFKNTIDEKISTLINIGLLPQISLAIEDSAKQIASDIADGIVGNVTGNITKNIMENLKTEINLAINRIVPEVAEKLIKEEIEKITSELGYRS